MAATASGLATYDPYASGGSCLAHTHTTISRTKMATPAQDPMTMARTQVLLLMTVSLSSASTRGVVSEGVGRCFFWFSGYAGLRFRDDVTGMYEGGGRVGRVVVTGDVLLGIVGTG